MRGRTEWRKEFREPASEPTWHTAAGKADRADWRVLGRVRVRDALRQPLHHARVHRNTGAGIPPSGGLHTMQFEEPLPIHPPRSGTNTIRQGDLRNPVTRLFAASRVLPYHRHV